jgi:hypothetical protein
VELLYWNFYVAGSRIGSCFIIVLDFLRPIEGFGFQWTMKITEKCSCLGTDARCLVYRTPVILSFSYSVVCIMHAHWDESACELWVLCLRRRWLAMLPV